MYFYRNLNELKADTDADVAFYAKEALTLF